MRKITKYLLLITLIILIDVINELYNFNNRLQLEPWVATPRLTYLKLATNPLQFRDRTNFTIELFYNKLFTPLKPWIDLNRNWFYRHQNIGVFNNNINEIDIRTERGCCLSHEDRLLRCILFLRGEKINSIAYDFDQSQVVCIKDILHVCRCILYGLCDKYMKPLHRNNRDFAGEFGKVFLSHFRRAIGVFDVTKVLF